MGLIEVDVRWMTKDDMPTVLGIEASCFEEGWNEEHFLHHLRQRDTIGMVATWKVKNSMGLGDVLGFMIYQIRKHDLVLLNFAVNHFHQRNRIGSQMFAKLKAKAFSHRRGRIEVDLRETNLAAQLFLRFLDFQAFRVHRGFYDNDEDAYIFEWLAAKEVPVG